MEKFTIEDVVTSGKCVGCGGCGAVSAGRIKIMMNGDGVREADLSSASPEDLRLGTAVCPFTDTSRNEDDLAKDLFPTAKSTIDGLGRFTRISASQVTDVESIKGSSSGGMTSWIASQLIAKGEVDGVIHVGSSEGNDLFAYRVSHTVDEVHHYRKSAYYTTSFDEALNGVRGNNLRYALVGVPCFIRSARLVCEQDDVLSEQLKFFIGLVCGHMKGSGYAESLAWQKGVHPKGPLQIDFRIKDPNEGSRGYRFGVRADPKDEWVTAKPREVLGGNWGHSVFQLEACNFCDDIYAETADVALGDAWLPKYEADWKGSNVVVSRNQVIDEILSAGVERGELRSEELSPDSALKAQAGNFRHRRVGLAVRLADDIAAGLKVPRKRVEPGYSGVSRQRIGVIRERRRLSARSFGLFNEAKAKGDLQIYLDGMRPLIDSYNKWSRPTYWQRAIGKSKRMVWKFRARFS